MEFMLIASVVVPTAIVVGLPVYFIRRYLKLRERQVAALEGAQSGGRESLLLEENRSLKDRIEKLESIVTSNDFELNRKLAAIDVPSEGGPSRRNKGPGE